MKRPILLVEDDDSVRAFIVLALQSGGREVLTTSSASEARKILLAQPETQPLCLVVDVVLNHESGIVFAREVFKKRPDGRILLISGFTDDVVLTEPDDAARMAFLPKPFTREHLLSALDKLCA